MKISIEQTKKVHLFIKKSMINFFASIILYVNYRFENKDKMLLNVINCKDGNIIILILFTGFN